MPVSRPRSLNGLVLLGFVLIAAPLLIAVVHAAVQMNRLARESAALVADSVLWTRRNQQLVEHITPLERTASLYVAGLRVEDVYRESHARFQTLIEELERPTRDEENLQQLAWLRRQSVEILAELEASGGSPAAGPRLNVEARFQGLRRLSTRISERGSTLIDVQLEELQARTDRTQTQLAWQAAALIPGTLVLMLVFTLLVNRPIRQIDSAISALGKGAFSKPIAIRGPTDLEALGRQLEWLRVRLLDLAKEKNRFLRHMSHELKTPLANLREGTELLIDGTVGQLDESKREVVTILRDNAVKLQQLIENLLSFSAWQSQNNALELSRFKLRPLFKAVLEHQQLTLISQQVRLDIRIADVTMCADRHKIRLILDNLLSNAIKYTPKGGVIYLHAAAERESLVLDVADSGPGIPAAERQRIFEAFYQGPAPRGGGHVRGTGIGLSVVLEFIQAHQGRIEIVDDVYPGAHFRIHLPLDQSPATAEVPQYA